MGARALGCLIAVAAVVAGSIGRRNRKPADLREWARTNSTFATHVAGVHEWIPVGQAASATAPWSWLVAAPARPDGVLEVAHDATRDQIEQLRRAHKDLGRCGDIVIQRASLPLPWLENLARGLSR